VGIENNDVRNFKDLRGIERKAKSLKRNERARRGILIAPSKLPRFSGVIAILTLNSVVHRLKQMSASDPRHAARMASGYQCTRDWCYALRCGDALEAATTMVISQSSSVAKVS